jgi:integrase
MAENGSIESAVRSWQTRLQRLFGLAGLRGHARRFRDNFAVQLLMSEVPIEQVCVLLGHQSVLVTERHYNPWVTPGSNNVRPIWARRFDVCARARSSAAVTRKC